MLVGSACSEVSTVVRHCRWVFVIPASSAECERYFSALNARHIITAQRNKMYPETIQVISVVLEGYQNKLIK